MTVLQNDQVTVCRGSQSSDVVCMADEILRICINIIGARDEYTQGHSHHVYVITQAIAQAGDFSLDKRRLEQAALLHDIGKILVPGRVLNKEGALDDEEWAQMRRHPEYGKHLVGGTLFEDVGDWILYHHERMDGKGYYGLQAEDIPLASKIIMVADTFSALRTYRTYRSAKPLGEAIAIMREAAGTQLDAQIVDALLSYDEDFLQRLECNCEVCKRKRAAEQAGQGIAIGV